jgi:hypothetical protein
VISANFPPIAGSWISVPGVSNPRLPDRFKLPVTEKKDMEPRVPLALTGLPFPLEAEGFPALFQFVLGDCFSTLFDD